MRKFIKKGAIYKYYKNDDLFKIICVAKNVETERYVVVYQNLLNKKEIYTRPVSNFLEIVHKNNQPMSKFRNLAYKKD